MGWFPRSERGLALGVRQMALPLGGAAAAVWLPWMAGVLSVSAALAGLGAIMLAGALVSLLGMREPATEPQRRSVDSVVPWRDASLWRLSGAAACLHAAQAALIAFLVLYLHDGRGLSVGSAAACLAIVQLAGALLRPLVGRWSDRAGRRIPLMRAIALAAAVLLAISALLGDGVTTVATLTLLLPAGVLALSWNGLGQTAAVELAGAERAGAALGLQNTAVSLASGAMPPLFGLLVQQAGWHAAFAVIAGLQMLAVLRLGPLVREEARRVSGPH
jgi:sugar phosphate permease